MTDENTAYQKLIRVIIIEDNPYMREGWSTILDFNSNISVRNTYGSCEEALELENFMHVDVVLLDIGLPGMDGTEGVKELLEINPKLAVVMATVFEDSKHIFEALRNGAIGYLIKKVSPAELVNAVIAAHRGGSPMSPTIARKVISSFNSRGGRSKNYNLSERESEVLQLLGEGNSYAAIAKTIFLSIDGVGYHIRNIYRKLQVNNKSEAVAKGISEGLIDLE